MLLPSVCRGATSLVSCGTRLPPEPSEPQECQVQGALELCNHRHCWVLGLCILPPAGVGSALRCASQGLRKMGFAGCARPRGGSRSLRCSGETSAERSSWRSPRPTLRMLKGCSSVEAALVVRDSSVGNVTCSILNPVLGQEGGHGHFHPRSEVLPGPQQAGGGGRVFLGVLSWAVLWGPDGVSAGLQSPSSPRPLPGRWLSLVSLTVLVICSLGWVLHQERTFHLRCRRCEKRRLCARLESRTE